MKFVRLKAEQKMEKLTFFLFELLTQNNVRWSFYFDLFILLYEYECFACIYVCHVCAWCPPRSVEGSGCSGTEVRLVVNCHVDAENRTCALCESNKCSKPRSRLSSPKMFSFVNLTQSRITQEEEGLARSGWPVDVSVGPIMIMLIDVGKPSPLWASPSPRLQSYNTMNGESELSCKHTCINSLSVLDCWM